MYIKKIKIQNFRSIYDLEINDLRSVAVISGSNDVGKSNVLKALNLFFNNNTDWNTNFDFNKDYNKLRREENKSTIKGRQFVKIAITFNRSESFKGSLPESFEVTRTWYRNSTYPDTTNNIEKLYKAKKTGAKSLDRSRASLQTFLNRIKYEYIPAIKEEKIFNHVLGRMQDIIIQKNSKESDLGQTINKFNETVVLQAVELNKEFKKSTHIDAQIKLPEDLASDLTPLT